MMKEVKRSLTLGRPATYEIKVTGNLDASWSDWTDKITITVDSACTDPPVTTLTGTIDQATLQGLLRRLYSMGLPLISVICVQCGLGYGDEPNGHSQKPGY